MPPLQQSRDILTPKQARFVQEFLVDLNATQAALRAGYAKRSAHVTACHLLKDPKIADALHAARQQLERRTEITQERVLQGLAKLAFFDPRKMFDEAGNAKAIPDLDDTCAAALMGFEVVEQFDGQGEGRVKIGYTKKYRLADRHAALVTIARHLGLLNERVPGEGEMPAFVAVVPATVENLQAWADQWRLHPPAPATNSTRSAGG